MVLTQAFKNALNLYLAPPPPNQSLMHDLQIWYMTRMQSVNYVIITSFMIHCYGRCMRDQHDIIIQGDHYTIWGKKLGSID